MRIFTVASEELISKPVSLVSMVKTERKKKKKKAVTLIFPSYDR